MHRRAFLFALSVWWAPARADGAYQLDIVASLEGGTLRLQPRVSGPPGKRLRYEMQMRRSGQSASAQSMQAGAVDLDASGSAQLATSTIGVGPGSHYEVRVRLYDGEQLVAERSLSGP